MVGQGLLGAVPLTRTLGLEVLEVTPTTATLRLPDNPSLHNHVGGPHAGALFSLAESASGAVVIAAFGATMARAVPLAVEATIRYRALAKGPVTATATLVEAASEVLDALDAGTRPEFDVTVALHTETADEPVSEVTVRWTLKPNRPEASAS
jgi:uncharacterized protein (TIGR00369 family)